MTSPKMDDSGPVQNIDREIWRERPGDFYSDSIHVTEGGGIGINCGGHVIVLPIRELHRRALRQDSSVGYGYVEQNKELIIASEGTGPAVEWLRLPPQKGST